MRWQQQTAPACPPRGRAGAVYFVAAVLAFSACDRMERRPATIELEADTVQLAAGVRIHDVAVETLQDGSEFDPARVDARTGDVLRFTAGDARMHALAFDGARLGADARAFLERTGQLRGPPLVTAQTQWVVNLAEAPAGTYPFTCITHGVHGELTVGSATSP